MNNLFIFRRDFRIIDNLGLHHAIKNKNTIPIFIFNPTQIQNNKYFSNNSFAFLIESLKNLQDEINKKNGNIHFLFGDEDKILNHIFKHNNINNVYTNKDFTPFAKKRDDNLLKICKNYDIELELIEDYNLLPMGTLVNKSGDPYKVYTPFYRNSKQFWKDIPKPKGLTKYKFSKLKNSKYEVNLDDMKKYYTNNKNRLVFGGRDNALKLLKKVKLQKDYSNKRNDLCYDTTHLSAYLKFGCISIRECFYTFKKYLKDDNTLFSQLFWREFYLYITNYFSEVLSKQISNKVNHDFQERFSKMKWENSKIYFNKWCKGETGFPIVDAGIRELLETGYMHNRSRLISSAFLIKLCLIDWRWGEKFFAQNLTDYDPAQNNGGWQFHHGGASGADYFRVLSPISQATRFDKNAEYIKKWLPELKEIPPKHLLDWEKYHSEYDIKKLKYHKPMFEYKKRRELALKTYKKSL